LVMAVAASTVASFGLGTFTKNGIPYVVLQRRDKERQYFGKGPYGMFGGFVNNGNGREQPGEALCREIREETTEKPDVTGSFRGLKIAPSTLRIRDTFMDYDHVGGEPRSTSTSVSISGFLLTPEQIQYMSDLSDAMKAGEVKIPEVEGYDIMPLKKAAELSSDKFTHAFAYNAIQQLNKDVERGQKLESLLGTDTGLRR